MVEKIKNFNKKNNNKMDVYSRFLDVNSEMGELSKEVLKATNYGKKNFEKTCEFVEEYGDVLYSFISLGLECEIDIEKAVEIVLNKYQKRIENKGNMSSK